MNNKIGIRIEDKNKWESRTPIVPNHVKELIKTDSLEFVVQKSPIRAFSDEEYQGSGATVSSHLKDARVIFAIKEVPIKLLEQNKTYIYFSHTVKGQKGNMPMLKHILDSKITLIDYEKIVNDKGFRLIYFGNFAGLAGMTQTLWAFGQRVKVEKNLDTPFLGLKHAYEYKGLQNMNQALGEVGKEIEENGLPEELVPLIVGFAGYGNVSKGAQSVLEKLPVIEIQPEDLEDFYYNRTEEMSRNHVYKVVFKEEDMVIPIKEGESFDLQDYYKFGSEKYEGVFNKYIPYLSILMNGIFWSEKYPKLLTKEEAKDIYQSKLLVRLQVVGDISCDIEGGIEPTLRVTEPDNPVFIYNPFTEKATLGFIGDGLAIMAVDNLPCELPQESSNNFSETLKPYVSVIAKADYDKSFEELDLPPVIKNAVISHKGELTPKYKYLEKFLGEI
jgi:saccharopine dehydrogenase (NAD+, L-lysine-forming)